MFMIITVYEIRVVIKCATAKASEIATRRFDSTLPLNTYEYVFVVVVICRSGFALLAVPLKRPATCNHLVKTQYK